MADEFRVFISAVTSEFGKARTAIADNLGAREVRVRVQDEFRQGDAESLLERLHNYIRDCAAVICVVGKRSGAAPPPAAAERFAKMLPPALSSASYTQWELLFARYYRRELYTYIADSSYERDQTEPKASDPQQLAFIAFINAEGIHWTPFSTTDQLRAAVLLQDWARPPSPPPLRSGKPIVLPYPSLGPLFKGREDFMRQLHESLSRGEGKTAITSKALYGLGGVGKTRAAVEYAWRYRDDYSALLFVVAETPEALRRNLASLATTLIPELDTTEDAIRLQAVLSWLSSNRPWFLILDNVDTKEALAESEDLLKKVSGGHVVLTSRLSNFSANFKPIQLDVLTKEDGAAFLIERTDERRRSAPDDTAKAREIVTELDGLALALEQAGAYIAKHRLTFTGYLDQWRYSDRSRVLDWFDSTVTEYPRSVAVTWQTSVAQLTEPGRRLLDRLAWFAPERVPEFLLEDAIPGAEADNLSEALADIASYSLVSRDTKEPYFLVHRLVQDVTRRGSVETSHHRLVETLSWINAGFRGSPSDVRDWPRLEALAAHARMAVAHADAAGILDPTVWLMNQLGRLLRSKASYVEAHQLARRALAIGETLFGPDDSNVAILLSNLAQSLVEINQLAEAERLLRRALDIDEKTFGQDHPKLGIRLGNFAQLLQETNRFAEAEPLMRRALAMGEKELGENHPTIAIRLNNLATLLQQTNRFAEAEPLIRRALMIDEKHFGANHPTVATRINNLAQLLKATQRLAEAEPLMRRALAIDEAALGPSHPGVATDLNNLALLLQDTNRLPEAEELMRRALSIDEESFGQKHPNVAIRLNNLAEVLRRTKRPTEAEPLMRRHAAIFVESMRATGHPHPFLEAGLQNYSRLLAALGKNESEIAVEIEKLRRGEP